MHPVPEFLFLHWPKRDPIRLLGAELAGSQDTMFDPIVNDMAADTEVFSDLLHGQFFGVSPWEFYGDSESIAPLMH